MSPFSLPRTEVGRAEACGVGGAGRQRGEETELVCGVAVPVGVVEHEDEVRDGEFVAMQVQCSDRGVMDGGRAAFEMADVVSRPKLSKSCTREGEFSHEFDGTGIADVVADGTAKRCDRVGCSVVPVVVELAFLRIEEEIPEPVTARCEARR